MFSDVLRQLRKSRKLNQAKLAEALGMSQATITFWENGKRTPDIEMLGKLADFFGVTTDYLLGRTPMEVEIIDGDPPPLGDDELEIIIKPDEKVPSADELEQMIVEVVTRELKKRGL